MLVKKEMSCFEKICLGLSLFFVSHCQWYLIGISQSFLLFCFIYFNYNYILLGIC